MKDKANSSWSATDDAFTKTANSEQITLRSSTARPMILYHSRQYILEYTRFWVILAKQMVAKCR